MEGTVPYTCEKGKGKLFCHYTSHLFHIYFVLFQVGMKAVCNGPATGCVRVDLEKCVVTPLSSPCFYPMSVSGNRFNI